MSRFAYADPPYVGQAKRHYGAHADFDGEVDQLALVRRLEAEFDGWALSLSVKSLPAILRACPDDVLVLAWFKPIAPPLGDHRRYNWEPVIVRPLRRYGPGYVPIAHIASPPQFTFRARPTEHVIGEKPESFAHWVFASAGLTRDDELHDLFPGSGAITRAWSSYVPGPTVADGYERRAAALPDLCDRLYPNGRRCLALRTADVHGTGARQHGFVGAAPVEPEPPATPCNFDPYYCRAHRADRHSVIDDRCEVGRAAPVEDAHPSRDYRHLGLAGAIDAAFDDVRAAIGEDAHPQETKP